MQPPPQHTHTHCWRRGIAARVVCCGHGPKRTGAARGGGGVAQVPQPQPCPHPPPHCRVPLHGEALAGTGRARAEQQARRLNGATARRTRAGGTRPLLHHMRAAVSASAGHHGMMAAPAPQHAPSPTPRLPPAPPAVLLPRPRARREGNLGRPGHAMPARGARCGRQSGHETRHPGGSGSTAPGVCTEHERSARVCLWPCQLPAAALDAPRATRKCLATTHPFASPLLAAGRTWSFAIGRTMYETDRVTKDFADRCAVRGKSGDTAAARQLHLACALHGGCTAASQQLRVGCAVARAAAHPLSLLH